MTSIHTKPLTPFQYWNRRLGEGATALFFASFFSRYLGFFPFGPFVMFGALAVALVTLALAWREKRLW